MSKIRKNYNNSFSYRFWRFMDGESAEKPEEDYAARVEASEEETTDGHGHFMVIKDRDPHEDAKRFAEMSGFRWFRKIYQVLAGVLGVLIVTLLIYNVASMPTFGSEDTAMNNEVMDRYLEEGQEETGSVNLVTGMILQYRAFDTFGETNVLFIATCTVMILLMLKRDDKGNDELQMDTDRTYEPKKDIILQTVARVVVPLIFLFGFYILLNGHLSPGGGFSGGAIMGAGLILHSAAFGFGRTQRFFNEHVYEIVKVGSLCLYALIITYYLFTGANGIASIVPLGIPGNIISAGLILPINILVGLEVACTMYAFYAYFRKGGF